MEKCLFILSNKLVLSTFGGLMGFFPGILEYSDSKAYISF